MLCVNTGEQFFCFESKLNEKKNKNVNNFLYEPESSSDYRTVWSLI